MQRCRFYSIEGGAKIQEIHESWGIAISKETDRTK